MKNLFPSLTQSNWIPVNLDLEARCSKGGYDFTNPSECNLWIHDLHRVRGADYSYGGFKENRSFFLANQYNKDEKTFIHIGTDYTIPSETKVALLADGIAVHVIRDKDQNGGWGGRLIFQLKEKDRYLIYGHLAHDLPIKEGDHCKSGDLIGKVGEIKENGGWWPHLHVQEIDQCFFSHFLDPSKIDGYLKQSHPLLDHVYNSRLRVKYY